MADKFLQQEGARGAMLVSVPQAPFADVSGDHCPAVVGRCGKPPTCLFETVTEDNAGRRTADRLN